MENEKTFDEKIEELFQAKARFHKELAKLPFEDKMEILFRLQEIAREIKKIALFLLSSLFFSRVKTRKKMENLSRNFYFSCRSSSKDSMV